MTILPKTYTIIPPPGYPSEGSATIYQGDMCQERRNNPNFQRYLAIDSEPMLITEI